MRAATLVGVASVPAGFRWIHLFGTGSATVLLFGPVFWVLAASLCIVCAAVAGWLVERTRPLVPWTSGH